MNVSFIKILASHALGKRLLMGYFKSRLILKAAKVTCSISWMYLGLRRDSRKRIPVDRTMDALICKYFKNELWPCEGGL